MSILRRLRTAILASLMALVLAAGAVYAGIPDLTGLIHACYSSTGSLRVIDSENGGKCKSSERALNWDQHGQVGPQGDPGPKGDPGDPGTNGISHAWAASLTAALITLSPDGQDLLSLTLPAGSYVLSATVQVSDSGTALGGNGQVNASCSVYTTQSGAVTGGGYHLAGSGTGPVAAPISMSGAITLPETRTVALNCSTWDTGSDLVGSATLTAIAVDTLTTP